MPKRHVVVHCMHERELSEALQMMPGAPAGEGVVVGELEDADIAKLEAQNILVVRLDEPPPPPLRPMPTVRVLAPMGARHLGVPAPILPPDVAIQYRVTLKEPPLADRLRQMANAGARILEAHPPEQVLRVFMTPGAAAAVGALPFVASVAEWEAAPDAETSELRPRRRAAAGAATEVVVYNVLLVDTAMHEQVRSWLDEHDVMIEAASGDRFRIHLPQDPPLAAQLRAKTQWVLSVERYIPPTLYNDVARSLVGLDSSQQGSSGGIAFEGDGQVIGVADTGIDQTHPDLQGRMADVIALGREGDATDPHGHGTHVTGSIAGDGFVSEGTYRGVAPKAKVVFQSLFVDPQNQLGGLPPDLKLLFQQAYDHGARIHNDSWGSDTASTYRLWSRDVDAFVHAHPDMLIVIAAGNAGTAADPLIGERCAQKGFVDWLSIGSPATAKNALTVGASRSSRTSGGRASNTYGDWPGFPDAPIKDARVSGDPECIMGWSSRGPCDNYRIKPDVVAPGTDILSCRSRDASTEPFWGPGPKREYAYMGGTSMAAPIVTGCAALIREYYVKVRGHEPSAALLKATLVNGTRPLMGADATADFPFIPNYHQGFGCIHMPDTIPSAGRPELALEFVDDWKDPAKHLKNGQRRRFFITVRGGGEIRLCLAYTDPPGPGVLNDLNLLVEGPNGGKKLFGNMQSPMGFRRPDTVNNVEILRIPNAAAGKYLVQIQGWNIQLEPQGFALVATGPFTGPIVAVADGGA